MIQPVRHSVTAALLALVVSAGMACACVAKDHGLPQPQQDCAALRQHDPAQFRLLCGQDAGVAAGERTLASPGTAASQEGDSVIMLYPGWQATTRKGTGS